MVMVCKGKCTNPEYKSRKRVPNLEESDYRKCSKCCIYILWQGLYCPCCGVRVSHRARNSVARRKKYEVQNLWKGSQNWQETTLLGSIWTMCDLSLSRKKVNGKRLYRSIIQHLLLTKKYHRCKKCRSNDPTSSQTFSYKSQECFFCMPYDNDLLHLPSYFFLFGLALK